MPKPHFRACTKPWYVKLSGKQIRLGSDRDQAFDEFDKLMASGQDISPLSTVAQLLEADLEWCLNHRKKPTYDNQRR